MKRYEYEETRKSGIGVLREPTYQASRVLSEKETYSFKINEEEDELLNDNLQGGFRVVSPRGVSNTFVERER